MPTPAISRSSVCRAAFLVCAFTLLGTTGASADGLVYQLPADGSWADYELRFTSSATVTTGLLRLRSVGRTQVDGDECRWIELSVTNTDPPAPDELFKLLIPEQYLNGGSDITPHVRQAWYQRGDAAPQFIGNDRLELSMGPVEMFLGGPLEHLATLEHQALEVAGIGTLDSARETGQVELAFDGPERRPVGMTVWRHPRSPFGTVQMRIEVESEPGRVRRGAVLEVTLVSAGTAEDLLDAAYRESLPNPVTVEPYVPTASRTDRVVLAEVFSGAGCPPCVAVDLAFEAALERYPRTDVALVMYHQHIPVPDPMTNPSAMSRAGFYEVTGVPRFFIDGERGEADGGGRGATERAYEAITPRLDEALETEPEAEIRLQVVTDGSVINVTARVDQVKSEASSLTLHLALVEDDLSYLGRNGTRFHPMVVRSLAGESAQGYSIDPSQPAPVEHSFDLEQITAELKSYLDEYEVSGLHGKITFDRKMHTMNAEHLSVVAFVQEEPGQRVLQAVYSRVEP